MSVTYPTIEEMEKQAEQRVVARFRGLLPPDIAQSIVRQLELVYGGGLRYAITHEWLEIVRTPEENRDAQISQATTH